ncbi:MAG: methylated-DNA--[protein]-cysteine S-methyltransferase [Thermoleophilia bacterium]|nr:methylated-DNA--[protein]-cysteine S-methyltransferase [Thermoleophilia bacterium]
MSPTDAIAGRFSTPWGQGAVVLKEGVLAAVVLPPLEESDTACEARSDDSVSVSDLELQQVQWLASGSSDHLDKWVLQLEQYFRGERLSWSVEEIPLAEVAKTEFAQDVYGTLMQVPPGATISYGELAKSAGYPRAARAVGGLMASNPIPVVIPCHRVIRADGSLGQYGKDNRWKALLLLHERAHLIGEGKSRVLPSEE